MYTLYLTAAAFNYPTRAGRPAYKEAEAKPVEQM